MAESTENAGRGKPRKHPALQWMEFLLFQSILLPLKLAGPRLAGRFGAVLGGLAYHIAGRRTRIALENLDRAFPEMKAEERMTIAKASWRHFGSEVIRYVATLEQSKEQMAERVETVGAEHLHLAASSGRGVILFSPHLGSWEAAVSVLAQFEMRFAVVARPLDNLLLDRVLRRARERAGIDVIPRRSAARAMLRALREGRGTAVLPDQSVRPFEGVLVPFLGVPAWTTSAPARLALRNGSALLGLYCIPDGEITRVHFTAPILVDDLPERERTVEAITRKMNDEMSDWIRRYPEYWLWMHDRWKHTDRPPGARPPAR